MYFFKIMWLQSGYTIIGGFLFLVTDMFTLNMTLLDMYPIVLIDYVCKVLKYCDTTTF